MPGSRTHRIETMDEKKDIADLGRHIVNMRRTLLFQACMPVKFLVEALHVAVLLINRTPPLNVLKGKSPHELLYKEKPSDLKYVRTF